MFAHYTQDIFNLVSINIPNPGSKGDSENGFSSILRTEHNFRFNVDLPIYMPIWFSCSFCHNYTNDIIDILPYLNNTNKWNINDK